MQKTKENAMSVASTVERLMLDLINEERISRGLDPLALELRLNDASEDHSTWMDDTGVFSHTGAGGSTAGDRIEDTGFTLSGNWTWGENIAFQSERGAPGIADDVADLHTSLMNSPGHRANILNPNFELIGIGVEIGDGRGYDAVYVTQNFARTSAPVQIDSGTPTPPEPDTDVLTGTAGNDRLSGGAGEDALRGNMGADTLLGRDGDDSIEGGTGWDHLYGGEGNDTVRGEQGNDRVSGGLGNDQVFGGAGADVLFGGNGADVLMGRSGNDTMFGGFGQDRLEGGAGRDAMTGGAGQDRLNGGAGNDTMTGGTASDVFVFSVGRDVVTEFSDADVVDLRGVNSITSFADLSGNGHLRQSGNNAIIDDLAGNTLALRGVDVDDLQANDFLF
ncbi:CAP domain-containing protein [uncultured Tateyamaria sp.]|uniref:CAP domain-containing protein n=1 Tax=uncultured Tateyamaria sp. TaxID=455651 RepID=UPI00260CAA01|nr:CAP domain-containing protein [uncultured Tateyamaria sp.]